MNKKFTFMVAALLAAGGFSANAADNPISPSELPEGTGYYYLVGDATTGGSFDNGDFILSMSVDEDGAISYNTTVVASSEIPATQAKDDAYLWKVTVTKKDNKKYVVLTNKKTGKSLAYNPHAANGVVVNIDTYDQVSDLKTKFEVVTGIETDGSGLRLNDDKEITVAENSFGFAATATELFFVKAKDAEVEADELKNLGAGIALDLYGEIEGEKIFENISIVTVEDKANDGKKFLFQVGKASQNHYAAADLAKDVFKEAEFIVLTQKELEDATNISSTSGTGYTYAVVKGKNLVMDPSSADKTIVKDKYPIQNGIFTAEKNADHEGQFKFKHASLYLPNTKTPTEWASVSVTGGLFIGYNDCGQAGTAKLASSATPVWASVSGGTAVSVKDLVKGKKLAYVMTTSGEGSSSFDYLLFDSYPDGGSHSSHTSEIGFTENKDGSELQKNYLTSQWYVSADENNTITLINRETGERIEKINLFTTEGIGVYKAKKALSVVDGKYLKFIDVEEATSFDGYLNLSAEELKEEYNLNTVTKVGNFDLDVTLTQVLNAGKGTSEINLVTETTNPLKWKFVQATKEVEDEDGETVNVVDTVYQITKYNYYKADKLVEGADTLKVFKYNLQATNTKKDASDKLLNTLNGSLALAESAEKAEDNQAFVLRKKGDKYIIMKAPANNGFNTSFEANNNFIAANNEDLKADCMCKALTFDVTPVETAPSYNVPESHFALEIGGAYLGANAKETGILTNDTTMLKSTDVDSSFSFWAFSADKEEAKTPSYYLSTNGKMMYNPADSIKKLNDEIGALSEVFEADKIAAKLEEKAQYVNGDPKDSDEALVKFQQAKYVNADSLYIVEKGINGDALKAFKFNVLDVDGSAVLKANDGKYVAVVNGVAVLRSDVKDAANFTVVAAEAPTSNESVSASEVKVVANNGSVVVKNATGKNVVVSTILGQVVANEVLTSDNATINVPAGIVVVAVEGESFKVNVK